MPAEWLQCKGPGSELEPPASAPATLPIHHKPSRKAVSPHLCVGRLVDEHVTRTCQFVGSELPSQPILRGGHVHGRHCIQQAAGPGWGKRRRCVVYPRRGGRGDSAASSTRCVRVGGEAGRSVRPGPVAGGGIWTWARRSCSSRPRSGDSIVRCVAGSAPRTCRGRDLHAPHPRLRRCGPTGS